MKALPYDHPERVEMRNQIAAEQWWDTFLVVWDLVARALALETGGMRAIALAVAALQIASEH